MYATDSQTKRASTPQHRQWLHPALRRLAVIVMACALILMGSLGSRMLSQRGAAHGPMAAAQPWGHETVRQLREKLQRSPENAALHAELGLALLAQVRTNADPGLYLQAEAALDAALARDPDQVDALVGQGVLALARHDFQAALDWADRAEGLNPYRAQIKGIQVDALVELGRYEEAVAAAQAMVDLRPDLHSYSRVSYMRELHGDVAGAIAAMDAAAAAGTPGSEPVLWSQVQLGNLHLGQGDLQSAREAYAAALVADPDYPHGLAGLARIHARQGRTDDAIAAYEALVDRLPLPEFVSALGDLYAADGRDAAARAQVNLVLAMQALNADAGMDVELELARFTLDHAPDGSQELDAALAQAQAVYSRRPTIYAADTLAWALYRTGETERAWALSQEALRLGTRDATLHAHAGLIAQARGDRTNAEKHLAEALVINPYVDLGKIED